MKVLIPGPLRSYTANCAEVEGSGATVQDVLTDLDRRYPGVRFRMIDEQGAIRTHVRFFVNNELASRLDTPLSSADTLHIICAISGG